MPGTLCIDAALILPFFFALPSPLPCRLALSAGAIIPVGRARMALARRFSTSLPPYHRAFPDRLSLQSCCDAQMDVPARQAYVALLVDPSERSAAGGITSLARSVGLLLAGPLLGPSLAAPPTSPLFDAPFFIAGGLKVVYDIVVWIHFRSVRPRVHKADTPASG